MKIRGQHYVWRFYLEPWMIGGKLWCLRGRKIFRADPKEVAKQRDFYRLKELNNEDIWLVRRMAIDPSPEGLKPLHNNLLKTFALIPKLSALAAASPDDHELREVVDEAINNTEELLQARVEQAALPLLEKLRSGDASFYATDSGAMDFIYYICLQHMRTKRVRDRFGKAVEVARAQGFPFDMRRVWNILAHIFATNMGWSLYADRKSYLLISAEK